VAPLSVDLVLPAGSGPAATMAQELLRRLPGLRAATEGLRPGAILYDLRPDPRRARRAAVEAGYFLPLQLPPDRRPPLAGLARRLDLVICASPPDRDWMAAAGVADPLVIARGWIARPCGCAWVWR
jgi:hypothetical protein